MNTISNIIADEQNATAATSNAQTEPASSEQNSDKRDNIGRIATATTARAHRRRVRADEATGRVAVEASHRDPAAAAATTTRINDQYNDDNDNTSTTNHKTKRVESSREAQTKRAHKESTRADKAGVVAVGR